MTMTPDEVVNVLKGIKEYGLDPDCFSNADKQQALSTAISLIQDYQKLREKIHQGKFAQILHQVFTEKVYNEKLFEAQGKALASYLQQPTEPIARLK